MDKQQAFEKIYTEGCTDDEKVRLLETHSDGEYKFMQTRQAWLWFSTGWDSNIRVSDIVNAVMSNEH